MNLEGLYIKKSKITLIDSSGMEIPDDSTVGIYMSPQPRAVYKPRYRVSGMFINDKQSPKFLILEPKLSTHHLYLSVLVNPSLPLDNYELFGMVWSSYFQDRIHGYYWQIVCTNKMSHHQILYPKLLTQS